MSKKIAILGDTSDHGGTIITHNQDGTLVLDIAAPAAVSGSGAMYASFEFGNFPEDMLEGTGTPIIVEGAQHSCPIPGHGITTITAVTTKSYHNSKLIVTEDAIAGCGAKITPLDRKVYVE